MCQLQLDELYAVLRDVKTGALSDDEAIQRLERSPYWGWTAMDPQSKLLLVIDVGTRTLEMAQRMVHQVVEILAPDSVPLCLGYVRGTCNFSLPGLMHAFQRVFLALKAPVVSSYPARIAQTV